jgi:eukaryotic-like serine/threonine-protein kinase
VVAVVADRYRLLNRLGAGGMSVVWRAHDDVLDREVAVKVLSADLAADTDLLHRIQVEARSAARLHHPNVVEVHDYGETDEGLPYVVMELVDGRSLAQVLAEGALPWRSAALVCSQVAAALAAAHARGIVHRDVKPSNVMVAPESVKLVDFGISATVGEADGVDGEVYGTPAYLAPERLAGGTVRPATDVYALGLLLYMTLAGHMPWRASTTTQMLRAHRYLDPSALPPVEGLPYEVADLCHQCLAKDPADRPSAAEAARILADAAGVTPAASLLAMLDAPTEEIRTRGRRRPLIAASVIAFLLLVAGIGWFGGRDQPRDVEALTAVPPAPTLECTVGYTVRSALNGELSTAVIITNTGRSTASDWRLTFDLPDGQKLVRGWSTGWAQTGRAMQFSGADLPAGGKLATGFDASYTAATTLPGEFRVDDTICRSQLSVAGLTTAPATTPATTPAKRALTAGQPAAVSADNSGKGSSNSGKGNGEGKDKGKKGKG